MAAELEKLAQDLMARGYPQASELLQTIRAGLTERKLIPDSLAYPFNLPENTPESITAAFREQFPTLADEVGKIGLDFQKTLVLDAPNEALRFNHDYVATEHVALALTRDEERVVPLLEEAGVPAQQVRSNLEYYTPGRERKPVLNQPALTPAAKNLVIVTWNKFANVTDRVIHNDDLFMTLSYNVGQLGGEVLESLGVTPRGLSVAAHKIQLRKGLQ